MKYIKTYEAFGLFKKIGDFFSGKDPNAPKFPTDPKIIDEICKKYDFRNYNINPDGTVDVNDRQIWFGGWGDDFDVLPLRFGTVTGDFKIDDKSITSLEGFPKFVDGILSIRGCKNLKSLQGCPEVASKGFILAESPLVTSLEGCPRNVGGSFVISGLDIRDLTGSPPVVYGDFSCAENKKLTTLKGCPERIERDPTGDSIGHFGFEGCDVRSFEGGPTYINGNLFCYGNPKFYDPSGIRHIIINREIQTYLMANPFEYKLKDDPQCEIDYINSRRISENSFIGKRNVKIKPSAPPITNVMKLFRTFDEFLSSLDYDYIKFEGGRWCIIEWKLKEAFSEFDLPSEELIEYFKKSKYPEGELGYKLI